MLGQARRRRPHAGRAVRGRATGLVEPAGPRPNCPMVARAARAPSVSGMPTAIITGASRGLGLALARALAARGWRLVIDARGADALERAARELARSPSVVALAGDVADAGHRSALVDAAGDRDRPARQQRQRARPEPAAARSPTTRSTCSSASTRVNVLAPLALVQLALPAHARRARAIVNVTSDAAVEAYEGWGGYGSSKAALEQLTAILAAEHPRAARLRGRPRRHAHADAPGGVPRRGHLRPPAARGQRARAARADRGRPARAAATAARDARRRRARERARAFDAARAPRGARAARGARARARRGAAAGRRARRRPRRARALPRPARRSSRPATCSSSTRRRRCPPRCRRAAPTARALDAAPLDAAARRRRRAGSSSCATAARAAPRRPRRRARSTLPGGAARDAASRPTCRRRGCGSPRSTLPAPLLAYLRAPRRARSATATSPSAWPLDGLPDRLRDRARQRRDAERRPPVHRRARHARWSPRGVARRADRAAHRRLLARARRAPVPRALPRARARPRGSSTPTRARGGRVIAVGTTVVRALETVAAPDGTVAPGEGWTDARRHARARRARGRRPAHRLARARGLAPADARGGRRRARCSSAPTRRRSRDGYLWHEFGDVHLILP